MAGDAILRRVGLAAHPAPDGVDAAGLEVAEPVALVAPDRFLVVGVEGVFPPGAQVQLLRQASLVDHHHLPSWGFVPPSPEPLGGKHRGVGLHGFQREIEGVTLEDTLHLFLLWIQESDPSVGVTLAGERLQLLQSLNPWA